MLDTVTPATPKRWPLARPWPVLLAALVVLAVAGPAPALPVRDPGTQSSPALLSSSSKYKTLHSLDYQERSSRIPETRVRGCAAISGHASGSGRRLKEELIRLSALVCDGLVSVGLVVSNNPLKYRDPRGTDAWITWKPTPSSQPQIQNFSTAESLAAFLKMAPNSSISRVEMYGHGDWGSIGLTYAISAKENGLMYDEDTADITLRGSSGLRENFANLLRPKLTNDALIGFRGCKTASEYDNIVRGLYEALRDVPGLAVQGNSSGSFGTLSAFGRQWGPDWDIPLIGTKTYGRQSPWDSPVSIVDYGRFLYGWFISGGPPF